MTPRVRRTLSNPLHSGLALLLVPNHRSSLSNKLLWRTIAVSHSHIASQTIYITETPCLQRFLVTYHIAVDIYCRTPECTRAQRRTPGYTEAQPPQRVHYHVTVNRGDMAVAMGATKDIPLAPGVISIIVNPCSAVTPNLLKMKQYTKKQVNKPGRDSQSTPRWLEKGPN